VRAVFILTKVVPSGVPASCLLGDDAQRAASGENYLRAGLSAIVITGELFDGLFVLTLKPAARHFILTSLRRRLREIFKVRAGRSASAISRSL
jgi:hypothetical protein